MPVKKKLVSDTVQRFTIWDNFARHVEELKAIGATDADLAPLRQAAEVVDVIEKQEALENGRNPGLDGRDFATLTQPYTCVNGWVVAPPTATARRYAVAATMRLTGGATPKGFHAYAAVIALSLFVLRTWGSGGRDDIMRLIYGGDTLAEMLPAIIDESKIHEFMDELSREYINLMGFNPSQKKTAATEAYQKTLSGIRVKYSGA